MRTFYAILASALIASSAQAAEYKGEYLGFGVGYYDVFDNDEAASFELNYQYDDIYYGLRPMVGVIATSDEAVYGFAGIKWDLPIGTYPVIISPSFAVGAYTHGDGKDLGHGLEFRSGIEVAYEFSEQGDRIGLQLSHLSNASIGDKNPGTEILQINYALPIDAF